MWSIHRFSKGFGLTNHTLLPGADLKKNLTAAKGCGPKVNGQKSEVKNHLRMRNVKWLNSVAI